MISVLVLGFRTAAGRPPELAESVRTLAALVPATVEGVVRDVILLALEADSGLAKVADHAGCTFVQRSSFADAVAEGARRARSDLILLLPAGVTFDRALTDEMASIAARMGDDSSLRGIRLRSMSAGALGRLIPSLVATVGLLCMRRRLLNARSPHFSALVRAIRPSRAFKTAAWPGE